MLATGERTAEGRRLVEQRAGRAIGHAGAAGGAGDADSPKVWCKSTIDPVLDAAVGDVERVHAFNLVAGADAARAEDAAVVVHPEVLGGHVHRHRRIEVRVADAVDAVHVALVLQAAIALVVLAHRADVIAFAEQQFQRGAAQTCAGVRCW